MLDECMEYLESKAKGDPLFVYEVIVVSDGSKDRTVEVAQNYAKKYSSEKVRVLPLVKNRGKGGAVRMVMRKRPDVVLLEVSIFIIFPGNAKRPR